VENSISAAGGDALDALKVTPGLRVQNDQISMIGKSGMAVMIDDRILQLSGDDLINYLKSIPSDNIKSIEVITTPPAKYDAEGNSGIVNIVLKKAKSDSWSAALTSTYTQSKYASFNESASFKFNKNKFSAYANVFHNDGLYYYRTENQKIYYSDKFYDSYSKMKYDYGTNISANAGVDYDLSKKISIGGQYIYNLNKIVNTDDTDTKIYSNLKNYSIETLADAENKRNNNSLNFHTTYKIDTLGRKIDFNFDYFNYNNRSDRTFATKEYNNFTDFIAGSFYSANNGSEQKISNYSFKFDVEHPLKWVKLSYGGRLSFTKNNSSTYYYDLTSGMPKFQPNRSDEFVYDENLQALYVSGSKKMGKWETQLGLRMENTQTEGISKTLSETHKNDYLKLFPTFYLQFTPNENHSFSFNYSKRISRPSFYSLNPFVRYISLYATSQGNPFLQPSYTHDFEFSYTYKDNWNTMLYTSFSKDMRTQVNHISNDNINTANKHENAYNETVIGLSGSFTFNKWKWWESVNSIDVYYDKTTSLFPEYMDDTKGFGGFFQTNNTFTLNKNKTFFLSLNYWFIPTQYEELVKFRNRSNFALGARALLLDKKLTVAMYASDIFRTFKMKGNYYFSGIKDEFSNYEYEKSIRLSIRYTFGNNNIKTRNIKSGNEEERGRAN
jgi:outer membrane receptor protein involved in Fe transport